MNATTTQFYHKYRELKIQARGNFLSDLKAGQQLEEFINCVLRLEERGWTWHINDGPAAWDFTCGDERLDIKGCQASKHNDKIFVETLSSPGHPAKWTLSEGQVLFVDTSWKDQTTLYCYSTEQLHSASETSSQSACSYSSATGFIIDTKKIAPTYKKTIRF